MRLLAAFSAGMAAAAAALASLLLAAGHIRSRRPSQACWAVSLGLFSLASSALAAAEGSGWSPALFRVYYAAGAVLNVPWMALGALYLFGPRRMADLGFLLTLGLTVFTILLASSMPIHLLAGHNAELSAVMASAPLARKLAVVTNAGGTAVALFLLLRASLVFQAKGVMTGMARSAFSLAAGIGAAAVGGVMAALEAPWVLAPSLAVGAVLMLTGFWGMIPRTRPADRASARAGGELARPGR